MTKDHFWRGPVTNEARARQIITAASWTLIGVAGLFLLSGLSSFLAGGDNILAVIIPPLFFAGPGAFLISRKNRASAIACLVVSGLTLALSVFGSVMMMTMDGDGLVMFAVIPTLILGVMTWLEWRAVQAAWALHSMHIAGNVANAAAEVFE